MYGDDLKYPTDPTYPLDKHVGFIIGNCAGDPTHPKIVVIDPDSYAALGEVTANPGAAYRDSEPMQMWTAFLADPPDMPGLVDRMQDCGIAHLAVLNGQALGFHDDNGKWHGMYVLDPVQLRGYDAVGAQAYEQNYEQAIVRATSCVRGQDGKPKQLEEMAPALRQTIAEELDKKVAAYTFDGEPITDYQRAEIRHQIMSLYDDAVSVPGDIDPRDSIEVEITPDMIVSTQRISLASAMRMGATTDEIAAWRFENRGLDVNRDSSVYESMYASLESGGCPSVTVKLPEGTHLPSGKDVSGWEATLPYFGPSKKDMSGPERITLPAGGIVALSQYDSHVERTETIRTTKTIPGHPELKPQVSETSRDIMSRTRTECFDTTTAHLFEAVNLNPYHQAAIASSLSYEHEAPTPQEAINQARQAAYGRTSIDAARGPERGPVR